MSKKVYKNGEWIDGKASPEHLSEELRILPSELVTKDEENPDAVHALDPGHVQEQIIDDWKNPKEDPDEEYKNSHKAYGLPPTGVDWPFHRTSTEQNQKYIDVIRLRSASALFDGIMSRAAKGKLKENETTVWHLWFPKDNVNSYELRPGNPPSRSEIEKKAPWLKDMRLEIDLNRPVPPQMDEDLLSKNANHNLAERNAEHSRIITDI